MNQELKDAPVIGAHMLEDAEAQPIILEPANANMVNFGHEAGLKAIKYAIPLGDLLDLEAQEPPLRVLYSDIIEGTLNLAVGPAKSGKTIFLECLMYAIAAGWTEYLGLPISIDNRRVLFISLEETWRNRCMRNRGQLKSFKESEIAEIRKNFIVVDDTMPMYLSLNDVKDRSLLQELIEQVNPGLVVIDSLGHLYTGPIEESQVAQRVMKHLKELVKATQTTLLVVHHVPKLHNSPLTLNAIAGSSVIGREADFVLGFNVTSTGDRYMKTLLSRYFGHAADRVNLYRITDSATFEVVGRSFENKILESNDGRRDSKNLLAVLEFLISRLDFDDGCVHVDEMEAELVKPNGNMVLATMYNQLKVLVAEGLVQKVYEGVYRAVVVQE